MNGRMFRNVAAWWLAFIAAFALLVLLPMRAYAADDASIAHAEATDDELRVLVEVPPGAEVSLGDVSATLAGEELTATASLTDGGTTVERTAILVIDTSNSMNRQGRFAAAKEAARVYLESVPGDVAVGIVTFDSDVDVALPPSTDRSEARAVLDELTLARQTRLYDALVTSIETAGETGQRSLLVLSDGGDTGGGATLPDVVAAVSESNISVDVVSLGQGPTRLAQLEEITESGNGQVLEADGTTLRQAFEAEAAVLANQVLVTAPLPAGFDAAEATIEIRLPTASGELLASAFVPIQDAVPAESAAPSVQRADDGWAAPSWLLPLAMAAFAVGAFGVAFMLVPARPQPMTIAERVSAYVGSDDRESAKPESSSEPILDQAKTAAAHMLHRNQGLESRLEQRLTAAGSRLKPSEWLLFHVGVVLVAGLVGTLLGGGSLILGVLFLAIGAVLPPVYLRFRATRRRKAFDDALPETLQLMSGALAAGLSLAQSVDTVVREGPEPVADEFRRVLVETRIGIALEDAFEGVADRFQSKDFHWVVMAIRIQRQVGGNLSELLTTVGDTMRERGYLRRQVQTLAAEGKLSAIILAGLPPAFLVFMQLTNPDYTSLMYTDPLGILMLGGAALWLVVGVFWMSRMVKVEI